GVEADEVLVKGGADLHQLEACLDLFNKHVNLDGAVGKAYVLFEGRKDVVPQGSLLGGLDLGQVQHQRGAGLAQTPMVIDDVEHRIDDGRGKAGASQTPVAHAPGSPPVAHAPGSPAHVAVVQMQATRAKELCREIELLFPVVDDGASEKSLRPLVHLARHLLGNLQEH